MTDREKLVNMVNDDSMSHVTNAYEHKDMYWGGSFIWYLILFFFIFIIILLIIISIEPTCVFGDKDKKDKHDEEDSCNWGWALLYAFFVTIILLVLIFVLYAISGYTTSSY
uniref:Membrane protein n=1 Tax=Pithovirus LCPAC102 TaxID=2506587 RepID=A0A4D5XFB2_9VIRU|nr:MAG: membrane protein [Pithovirus LCPAC102]